MSDAVRVLVRCRPFGKADRGGEETAPQQFLRLVGAREVQISRDLRTGALLQSPLQFTFDAVFGPSEICEYAEASDAKPKSGIGKQADVFDRAARDTVDDVLGGFNGTIFVYGQTGSGKSHTMFGEISAQVKQTSDEDGWGIIPRSLQRIFDFIESTSAPASGGRAQNQFSQNLPPAGTEFFIKCSFLEVYKEVVRDLLNPDGAGKGGLRVRESPTRGVWIDGLSEHCIGTLQEALDLIRLGERSRVTSATRMNETSSRSHSLFIISLQQRHPDGSIKTAKLNLVDLAGSEKVGKTGAIGETLDEAKKINQSLSALGNVINALGKRGNNSASPSKGHIPYRDSKLTHILRESLGGNCKTTLLVTISPAWYNAEETLSTLRFGLRAKAIQNVATKNVQRSVEELNAIIARLGAELDRAQQYIQVLEQELIAIRGTEFVSSLRGSQQALARTRNGDGESVTRSLDASPEALIRSAELAVDAAAQIELRTAEIQSLRDDLLATEEELEEHRAWRAAYDTNVAILARQVATEKEDLMRALQNAREEKDAMSFALQRAELKQSRSQLELQNLQRPHNTQLAATSRIANNSTTSNGDVASNENSSRYAQARSVGMANYRNGKVVDLANIERELHAKEVVMLNERIAILHAEREREREQKEEVSLLLAKTQAAMAEAVNAHNEELRRRDDLAALQRNRFVQRPARTPQQTSNDSHLSTLDVLSHNWTTRKIQVSANQLKAASHEGFLVKQGGLMRIWQKRWFVLASDRHLYYFADCDCEVQKGTIPLDECRARPLAQEEAKGRNFVFGIFHATRRTFLLQATTPSERNTWIARINEAAEPTNTAAEHEAVNADVGPLSNTSSSHSLTSSSLSSGPKATDSISESD